MAASDKTVKQFLEVCERHFNSQQEVKAFVDDLYKNVQGNVSVRFTLTKIKEATQ